uniref:Uncharacterized protein n=1 Tax=Rhizophagus irregularis (strain DAOM 181602 / DAOM 197198 / MUCL 43194) TaxID=747089 RepID=U9TIR0_RHIID
MESSKELNLQRNGDSINNFIIFTGNVDSFKIELRPVTHLPGYNPGIVSGLWNSKRARILMPARINVYKSLSDRH